MLEMLGFITILSPANVSNTGWLPSPLFPRVTTPEELRGRIPRLYSTGEVANKHKATILETFGHLLVTCERARRCG